MTTAVSVPSPYKGLAPFEDSELDALMFFGREGESEIVAMNMLASRLTVLYGPSGVGKSSLLRAAVARQLRALAPDADVVVCSSWRDDPVATVHAAIDPDGDGQTRLVDAVGSRPRELYLILDQFEEYFLYHADARGPTSLVEQLPELVNADLPVNVLLGIREDALARLDVFKARLPRLFGNYLRLDHLDRESARDAILGPLARYGELTDELWGAQPELVEAVLDEVAAGKIDVGRTGRAITPPGGRRARVEAPFLQLVLQRLWEVERARGSTTLTLETLRELGGAEAIVEDHLERALSGLSVEQQDAAAAMFSHLVTPSGTKIAHRLSDLATYASMDAHALEPVVGALAHERILRPLRDGTNGDGHYEIYHDVLAEAVLLWRRRHEAQRELVTEQRRARERYRRMLVALAVVGAALAAMTAIAAYAFSQRSEAREQTAIARAKEVEVASQKRALEQALVQVRTEKRKADAALRRLSRTVKALNRKSRESAANLRLAEHNLAVANANERRLERALADLTTSRNNERLSADAARNEAARANSNERRAKRGEERAQRLAGKFQRANASLSASIRQERAGRLVAQALANLNVDPQRSLEQALAAARLERSPRVEDALRNALLYIRLHAVLPGGGREVSATAYSRDGALIGLAAGGNVRIFRSRDFSLLHDLRAAGVTTVAFSPDRSLVAAGAADGAVRVWSTGSGALVRTLTPGGRIVALSFSPNGSQLLTGSTDATARVFDVGTYLEVRRFPHPPALRGASFSRDGRYVLTYSADAAARVHDVAGGSRVALLAQQGEITAAAWSPTGDTIATTGRRNAYIWESGTWERRHLLVGHTAAIHAVAYSLDGARIATVGVDGAGRVWNVANGAMTSALTGHYSELVSVAFGPDGTIATGSTDRTVRIWRGPLGALAVVLAGHTDSVTSIAFAPEGDRVLTGSDDGHARVWDTGGEPRLTPIARHGAGVTSVETNADGSLVVSGGADGTARIWRAGSVVVLQHGGTNVRATLDRDARRILTWGDDGTAKLWTSGGARLAVFAHGAPVAAGALSLDATLVVTASSEGIVRIWGASGALRRTLRQGGGVTVLTLSDDASLLAAGGPEGAARVWRTSSGESLALTGHDETITAVGFSPDGRRVATASLDDTARIWSTRTGASEQVLEGRAGGLTTVRFSPNGRLVLTAGRSGDAHTWRVSNGERATVFRGHVSTVSDARFSADGRWVVTAGPTAAGLWKAADGARLFFLRGHTQALRTASFSRDGRWIVTGGAVDATVQRYRCRLCGEQAELATLAQARLGALERARRSAQG